VTRRERYLVILEPVGDDAVPVEVRLRIALKRLLRCYGLRARSVEVVKGSKHPPDGGTPGRGV
jgi:hypothetical protein